MRKIEEGETGVEVKSISVLFESSSCGAGIGTSSVATAIADVFEKINIPREIKLIKLS